MSKMTKIKKYLNESHIDFEESAGRIRILLEKDCIWINGFGEEMKYDKAIAIIQNNYKDYIVDETTGYSMSHKLVWTSKQEEVIRVLQNRFKE